MGYLLMQHRVYQTKYSSVFERRVIDVWCGLEQSTINMAMTTSVEDFERASIRKEDNSNTSYLWTHDINFVSICHFQCNFCMTVTALHLAFKTCACNVDN